MKIEGFKNVIIGDVNRLYGYFSYVLSISGFEDEFTLKTWGQNFNNVKRSKRDVSYEYQLKKRGKLQNILYKDDLKGFIYGFIFSYTSYLFQIYTSEFKRIKFTQEYFTKLRDKIVQWIIERVYLLNSNDAKILKEEMTSNYGNALICTNMNLEEYYFSFSDNYIENLQRTIKRVKHFINNGDKTYYKNFFKNFKKKTKKISVNLNFIIGFDRGYLEGFRVEGDFIEYRNKNKKNILSSNSLTDEINSFVQLILGYKKDKKINDQDFFWRKVSIESCMDRQSECFDIKKKSINTSYLN